MSEQEIAMRSIKCTTIVISVESVIDENYKELNKDKICNAVSGVLPTNSNVVNAEICNVDVLQYFEGKGYEKLTIKPRPVYSQDEVKSLVQSIYSEFAELPLEMHTTNNLRAIIEQEVEQRPVKPITIFK